LMGLARSFGFAEVFALDFLALAGMPMTTRVPYFTRALRETGILC